MAEGGGMRATRKDARAYQLNLSGGKEEAAPKRRLNNEEAQHQALLFVNRLLMLQKYPVLRWLFATLNGLFIPRHLLAKAVEAGMAKGILDLWYPVRRIEEDGTVYCGLAMDLKKLKDGRATKEQKEWAAHLAANGWRVYFPEGVVDAWRCLCCYAGISGEDHIAAEMVAHEDFIRRMSEER
jgi:hypothetical protein